MCGVLAMGGSFGAFLHLSYRSRGVTSAMEFGRLFGRRVEGLTLRRKDLFVAGTRDQVGWVGCRFFGGLSVCTGGTLSEGSAGGADQYDYCDVLVRLESYCDLNRASIYERFDMLVMDGVHDGVAAESSNLVELVGHRRLRDSQLNGSGFSEQRLFKDVREVESWISRGREVFGSSVLFDDEVSTEFCKPEYVYEGIDM